jgi:hypothetical protein
MISAQVLESTCRLLALGLLMPFVGLTVQADQRRRVDFMQKGSMVEICSTGSSGSRIQRSKWMAMDAKQTTLTIGAPSPAFLLPCRRYSVRGGWIEAKHFAWIHALSMQVQAAIRSSIMSHSPKSPKSDSAIDQAQRAHLVFGSLSLRWLPRMQAIISMISVLAGTG